MKTYSPTEDFLLESSQSISALKIAYKTYGHLNKNKDNVIWVFHAISGHCAVLEWWSGLFGPGKLYDPANYFIICANSLGSPYGSTKPTGLDFPSITVRDVVSAHILLAKSLGINKIHTAIGGSFGGYQALEFAYSFKGEIEHLILLASSAKESAWGIAIHESQRMALKADPTFGQKDSGLEGMKAARAIAMLTYRTSEALIEKQTDQEHRTDNFKAASYINYQGDKFSKSFDALSFYYLTKCIDTHNIGRHRGGQIEALKQIKTPTLVLGFKSDTLVPIRFQSFLAEHIPNALFEGFESEYGHDGFLLESQKISQSIGKFYNNQEGYQGTKRTVLKFGGTSLYGKTQLANVLTIIKEAQEMGPLAIVVSARGKSTNKLSKLFNLAKDGLDYSFEFNAYSDYLRHDLIGLDISNLLAELKLVLSAIQLLRDDSEFAYDRVVSFGEIISAQCIAFWLNQNAIKATYIDARDIIFTNKILGDFEVNMDKSRAQTKALFSQIPKNTIPIITGFIASSEENKTVTLGQNGSNYTASLIANFIQAKEVQNWTDVEGIYSAHPSKVPNAQKINAMTYKEANELSNFGMNLLHPKTIRPLMQAKIPLIIKSTNAPNEQGTMINQSGNGKGIKTITTIEDVALVEIAGNELAEKIGIDARIFSCLHNEKISVKMISQASSERGIGFVISSKDAAKAELGLTKEFKDEIRLSQISSIRINDDIGIVAIIGRHNYALEKAIKTLRLNKIWMHLISNSISGNQISLVVNKQLLDKAARLVHEEVFRD